MSHHEMYGVCPTAYLADGMGCDPIFGSQQNSVRWNSEKVEQVETFLLEVDVYSYGIEWA